MTKYLNRTTTVAGIAIFSMFFGAGNTVFPLMLGQVSGDKFWYAFAGLLITAIGGPVIGLTGSLLYKGKTREFFSPVGPFLGTVFLVACLALLGPFAVLPRCIIVAYAALCELTTSVNMLLFTTVFSLFALLASLREKSLLSLLGYVLSPLLIICLISIISIAFVTGGELAPSSLTAFEAFKDGLLVGYDTLDMVAAIIFASSIWVLLGSQLKDEGHGENSEVLYSGISAGAIGGGLLGLVYVGLSWAAALHAEALVGASPEELLPTLATSMLGPWFGAVANLAVCLACFTTVVSLMCSLALITGTEVLEGRVDRKYILLAMSVITFIFANTSFGMIMSLIHPVISVCYPAIIVLTIYNIFNFKYGWKQRRSVVYAVTLIALACSIVGV